MRKLLLTTVAAGALLVALNGAEAQRMNDPGGSQSPGISERAPRADERSPVGERRQSDRTMERRDDGAVQQERRGRAEQERRGQRQDGEDRTRDRTTRDDAGPAQKERFQGRERRQRAGQDDAQVRKRDQTERRGRERDAEQERRARPGRDGDRDQSVDRDDKRSVDRDRDRRRDAARDRDRDRTEDRRGERADRDRTHSRVNLNSQERVRVTRTFSTTIERRNIRPLRNVRFSIRVGVRVPRDIRLHNMPADIVRIHPGFRGYRFVLVRNEIVIVDPTSYRIVTVLPRSGSAMASARVSEERESVGRADARAIDLNIEQRRVIRERVIRTADCRHELRLDFSIGIPLPRAVEVCEFPQEVLAEVPEIRSYRYIMRDDRVVIVDPDERRVIEVID